ncbi:AGAP011192-PA-like protein [Anopheles sinensis]|uniref:AGAP011192-PA-like protein n=1 Tax=Anopheles sinensis TaxID=74873 RepID=A0A084WCC1_ANOSI|nr:AGAP011192-PA-like protein [Anopheles sinensis]
MEHHEQRLLLEDMVEQEKREQANQLQQVSEMPANLLADQQYDGMMNNPQGIVRGPQQSAGMVVNQLHQNQQQQQLQSPPGMHGQIQMQSPNGTQFMLQQQQQQQQQRMNTHWRPQTPVQTTAAAGAGTVLGGQISSQPIATNSQMAKTTTTLQTGAAATAVSSPATSTDPSANKSIPLFQANLQPQPPQPPETIATEQDRVLQINYENWLNQQNTVLSNQLKYYETEIVKLRKVKKQLNTKQRHLRKQGNELTDNDAKELQKITADHGIIQKQLENARRQQRQHSVILQDYKTKHPTSKPAASTPTPVGAPPGSSPAQSLIAPPSPLMSPSPSSQPGSLYQPPVQSPLGNPILQPNQSPLHSPSPLLSHSPGPASVNSVLQSPGGNHTNSNSAMSPYSTMQPSPRIGTPHSQIDENPFSPGPTGGPSPSPSIPGRLTSPAPRMTSPQHRVGGQQLVGATGRMHRNRITIVQKSLAGTMGAVTLKPVGQTLVDAEVSLNSVAHHGTDGDEAIIETFSTTPTGYEIVGSPLDSQIVAGGEYNLFSDDVVECVDSEDGGGGGTGGSSGGIMSSISKKDSRTVTVELLMDDSSKDKPLLGSSEIEIVESVDDSNITTTAEDFEAMIDSRPKEGTTADGGVSETASSAKSSETITVHQHQQQRKEEKGPEKTMTPTKEMTIVTVQHQQQNSPKPIAYPAGTISIQKTLMQNRPIVSAAHQRLVKDATETTAKLSIGNTTISVPILKKSFPMATASKTGGGAPDHQNAVSRAATTATTTKKILNTSGLSISNISKNSAGGTVIAVAGQKINTTSIVTLSSLNLNQSAPFITKTFARPGTGAVTIQQQKQLQAQQLAVGSQIKIQQAQALATQLSVANVAVASTNSSLTSTNTATSVQATTVSSQQHQPQIENIILKSKPKAPSPSLSYSKLSTLTVTQDTSLPTKIFEDDSISPDSSISQEDADQLPLEKAEATGSDSLGDAFLQATEAAPADGNQQQQPDAAAGKSKQNAPTTTAATTTTIASTIPVHVISKSRENSRSPILHGGERQSTPTGQRIVSSIPQLSPLSQPNELTLNAMNVSQQVRSIMSSINVSSATTVTASGASSGQQTSTPAATVASSNISTITFDTIISSKGDNMSKTETIASILKTVSGKTILPAAAIASNSANLIKVSEHQQQQQGGGMAAGPGLTTATITSIPGTKLITQQLQLSRIPGQTIGGGNNNILVVKQVRAPNKQTGPGGGHHQKQLVVLTQGGPGGQAGGGQQIKLQPHQQQQLASGNSVTIQSQPAGGNSGGAGGGTSGQGGSFVKITTATPTVVSASDSMLKTIVSVNVTPVSVSAAAPSTSILSATLSQPLLKSSNASAISTLLQNQLQNATAFRRSKSTDEAPGHHGQERGESASQILSKRLSLEAANVVKIEPVDSVSDDTNVSSSSSSMTSGSSGATLPTAPASVVGSSSAVAKPDASTGSGCKFSSMSSSTSSSSSSSSTGGMSKSEDSQNVLLKQLLQNSGGSSSSSGGGGGGGSSVGITGGSNPSVSSPAPSPSGRAVPSLITNQRAPSLGVVSSLQAQLARPVIPPSANPPAIQIISTQSIAAAITSTATSSSISTPSSSSTSSSLSMTTTPSTPIPSSSAASSTAMSSVTSATSSTPAAVVTPVETTKPKLISRETSFVSKPAGISSSHPTPNLAANMLAASIKKEEMLQAAAAAAAGFPNAGATIAQGTTVQVESGSITVTQIQTPQPVTSGGSQLPMVVSTKPPQQQQQQQQLTIQQHQQATNPNTIGPAGGTIGETNITIIKREIIANQSPQTTVQASTATTTALPTSGGISVTVTTKNTAGEPDSKRFAPSPVVASDSTTTSAPGSRPTTPQQQSTSRPASVTPRSGTPVEGKESEQTAGGQQQSPSIATTTTMSSSTVTTPSTMGPPTPLIMKSSPAAAAPAGGDQMAPGISSTNTAIATPANKEGQTQDAAPQVPEVPEKTAAELAIELKKKKRREYQKNRRQMQIQSNKDNQSHSQAKKKPKKSVKVEEDYDTCIDNLMAQLRQLPPMQILEPQLPRNYGVCPVFGTGDLAKFTNLKGYSIASGDLTGSYGSAQLPSVADFYNTKPFGVKDPPPEPVPTSTQRGFYDQEFAPIKFETEERHRYEFVRDRDLDSPDTIISTSSPECIRWESPICFPGLRLIKEEPAEDDQVTVYRQMSPVIPILAPIPIRLRKGMTLSAEGGGRPNGVFGSNESNKENEGGKDTVIGGIRSRFGPPTPLKDTSNVTVTLTLTSSAAEDIFGVLRDLANILDIPPPTTYQIVERTMSPTSQKLGLYRTKGRDGKEGTSIDIQTILNGSARFCRHCDVVILNSIIIAQASEFPLLSNGGSAAASSQELESEELYFCGEQCYRQFKWRPTNILDEDGDSTRTNEQTVLLPGGGEGPPGATALSGVEIKQEILEDVEMEEVASQNSSTTDASLSGERKKKHPDDGASERDVLIGAPPAKQVRGVRYKTYSPNCFPVQRFKKPTEKEITETLFRMSITVTPSPKMPDDTRRCIFCHTVGDGVADGPSRLLNYDVDKWVHLNCALWSDGVYETVNGALMNLENALQQSLTSVCAFCNNLGATIKCFKTRCANVYHLSCAMKDSCVFYKNKTTMCQAHAPKTEKDSELTTLSVQRRVYVDRDESRQVASVMHHSESSNLLRVGSLIFLNVGQLLPHQLQNFHTPNYIYPIGYKIIRFYWSMRHPNKRCQYICSIADVSGRPEFRVLVKETAEPDIELRDATPKAVWHRILEEMAQLRKNCHIVQLFPRYLTGEDLFGLTEPAVVRILESLPGIETLTDYRFKYGRNPLLELPLAINPSGAARTEAKLKHTLSWKKPHTQRTGSASQRPTFVPTSSPAGEVACPYSKQFVHSKSSQYKKMKQEWRNNVFLARSKIQGLGLYAARDLEKHTMVIEYIGEVIRTEVSELREKQYEAKNRGIYMFRLDEERVVDATLSGGLARYINHSCNPNCVTETVEVDRELRIIIFAKRRINRGEELSYDYKFDIEDDAHKISCMCGAPNCKKWMN